MAWNEPGGSKDNDPWGNKNKGDQGPPDLDEVIRKMQNKLGGLFGGKKGGGGGGQSPGKGGTAGMGIMILVLVGGWLVYDMVHIIQPAERGVVMRFGEYVDTMQPGLGVRLPRPIETVERVDVAQIRNVEIGYRSSSGGRSTTSTSVGSESLMLTRDENIVDAQFAVQYRIKSARDYLFNVRNPDLTLRESTESAVREVVGKSNMDFVLTEGRGEIVNRIQALTQDILDRYETGLIVTSVNMQDAQPPDQVQDAFDDAVKAREDRIRLINEAEAYSNNVLPRARGAAARQIEEANAYKEEVVAKAEGEAQRFENILSEYTAAPDVTRQRLYLETMEEVLSNSSKVMVDVEGGNNIMYLPLDRIMRDSDSTPLSSSSSDFSSALSGLKDQAQSAQQLMRRDSDVRSRERR
ncbi:HflK protein [Candidatus Tenderia electrophaga]|jgi:membrane protease subunit HflK|uniref:Protein HflK n=1 Tax=Candidatus Tenderia electrophaga TaxID=1748243 RepID=A0A0S2TCH3_9GAMM|nr:HflK protein [Candidatus Tenderia electrophaga]